MSNPLKQNPGLRHIPNNNAPTKFAKTARGRTVNLEMLKLQDENLSKKLQFEFVAQETSIRDDRDQ